ncbi:MAG: choline dehydrogenase-like flavoprotein [Flavobacteriales bacterium]|jgi:choline dehydrogenase-like flavoprotein
MIYGLDDVRQGFDITADAVVIGSGAGGAVAAANLAAAGLKTVLIEAGPHVTEAQMTRDGPAFLSKYYWEGGLRMLTGSGAFPSMAGRCLGGSTVVNSAIMFALPDWVRAAWIREEGLDGLADPALDAAYARVFERTNTAPTPMNAMGKRNLMTRDIMDNAGLPSAPLPRAVKGCKGSGDCLTGCAAGAKQSVDRSYLPNAIRDGLEVYTCSVADKVLTDGTRAVGVTGEVVDPIGRVPLGRWTVRAPRVFVAAGTLQTPVLLQQSGITQRGTVGGTFAAHISSYAVGVMPDVIDPWVGATQGWGAFSDRVQGLKFEALWAPTSLIAAQWGGVGDDFYAMLPDLKHACTIALVYRAKVKGRVTTRRDGMPNAKLWIPKEEMWVVMRELKRVVDSMLDLGGRYVYTGVKGVPRHIRTPEDANALLATRIRPKHVTMTANHTFASCRMSASSDRGAVDPHGKVYGMEGLWLCDASIFPSPSAVNPQATVMALSDVISRRAAELAL